MCSYDTRFIFYKYNNLFHENSLLSIRTIRSHKRAIIILHFILFSSHKTFHKTINSHNSISHVASCPHKNIFLFCRIKKDEKKNVQKFNANDLVIYYIQQQRNYSIDEIHKKIFVIILYVFRSFIFHCCAFFFFLSLKIEYFQYTKVFLFVQSKKRY